MFAGPSSGQAACATTAAAVVGAAVLQTQPLEVLRRFQHSPARQPRAMAIPDRGPANVEVTVAAGAVAGVVSRTCTAPLDRLKTLIVLRDPFKGTQRVRMSATNAGVLDGLRLIYQEGGLVSFWRGNLANCVKVVPETAIKFAVFERLKPSQSTTEGGNKTFARFLAGAAAGMVAQAAVYPLDVVKTRIVASETGVYRGMADCLTRTVRIEGPKALCRGMGTSLVGMIPYAGIDLAIFDFAKGRYVRSAKVEKAPVPVVLACGVLSSSVAQACTYPIGLVRQRLQAQGMTPDRPAVFKSPIDCFQMTYRKAGVRGLYAGFFPTLLKVVPAAAISYASYESAKDALRTRVESENCEPVPSAAPAAGGRSTLAAAA
eukprot:TRINITY_DN3902_c3_g1_i2.p1 TRINITY_DN3902_c3_g1~~TRINITY_DN3902_c3_g1_i2.p1  ORF type:complete len:374 (+),score=36.81 TRINITY_DN3902_c3_g1_i2:146-1267(+)